MNYETQSVNIGGAKVVPQETVQSVVRDLDNSIQRLQKLAQHLCSLGDRIEGSRPEDANAGVDTPPHSLLDELQRKRQQIASLISVCENYAMRIDNVVGGPALKSTGPRLA